MKSKVVEPAGQGAFYLHVKFPHRSKLPLKRIGATAIEGIEKRAIRIPEQLQFTKGFPVDQQGIILQGMANLINETVIDPDGQSVDTPDRGIKPTE